MLRQLRDDGGAFYPDAAFCVMIEFRMGPLNSTGCIYSKRCNVIG